MTVPQQPPPEGRYVGWLNAIKGLTISNVLVIALLAIIAAPLYVLWSALHDEKIMDRLLSTYEEDPTDSGCLLRHVQERGGPDLWGVSSGFAFQGQARWFISVVFPHQPKPEEVTSYCESLKLLADRLGGRHDDAGNATGP